MKGFPMSDNPPESDKFCCKRQRMTLSGVCDSTSSHKKHADEIHRQKTLVLEREKNKKYLEFFVTKTRRIKMLRERYKQLEKDLMANLSGESSYKMEKSKLDKKFKLEFQELCSEMDKYWENLRAADLSGRNEVEEQGLTGVEQLMNSAIAAPEELDGTQMNASSDLISSTNPCTSPLDSILVSESRVITWTNDQMPTPSPEISTPVPPIEGSSSTDEKVLHGVFDTSPVSLPNEQMTATPVESDDKQTYSTAVPAIVDESTLPNSSPDGTQENASSLVSLPAVVSEVVPSTLKETQHCVLSDLISNQDPGKSLPDVSDEVLLPNLVGNSFDNWITGDEATMNVPHDISKTPSEFLSRKEAHVAVGADNDLTNVDPAPVPDDKPASPVSPPQFSVPITSENVNTFDCSPLSVSELETVILREDRNQSPQIDTPCSLLINELGFSHDNPICFEDEEQTCDNADAVPIDAIEVSSDESPGNQQEEGNIMPDTVSYAGRSYRMVLPNCLSDQDCSAQGSIGGNTAVGQLRQQFPANSPADSFSSGLNGLATGQMLQHQRADRDFHLPLEQFPVPARPPNLYSGLMGCSQQHQSPAMALLQRPDAPAQFDTLMEIYTRLGRHSTARGTQEIAPPQIPSSSYSVVNNQVSTIGSLFQAEIESIRNAKAEATKKHDDTVLQLGFARDRETAQINEKYDILLQDASNDLTRKKKELEMRRKKTIAHRSLAETWRLVAKEANPIEDMFELLSLLQSLGPASNGTQPNAFSSFPQMASQFPSLASTNPVAWTPHGPNSRLPSHLPPLTVQPHGLNSYPLNQQALNFRPSGSYPLQLANVEHYPFLYGAPN